MTLGAELGQRCLNGNSLINQALYLAIALRSRPEITGHDPLSSRLANPIFRVFLYCPGMIRFGELSPGPLVNIRLATPPGQPASQPGEFLLQSTPRLTGTNFYSQGNADRHDETLAAADWRYRSLR